MFLSSSFFLFYVCLFFQNQCFQKILSGISPVSNNLDPGQARHFVWPDLDTNSIANGISRISVI